MLPSDPYIAVGLASWIKWQSLCCLWWYSRLDVAWVGWWNVLFLQIPPVALPPLEVVLPEVLAAIAFHSLRLARQVAVCVFSK